MTNLANDIRYALRMLRKNPGFTLVAVLMLGLGVGANATIFTWLHSFLLNPLAGVAEPQRIVDFVPRTPTEGSISISYPDYLDYRARSQTLDGVIAHEMQAMSLAANGRADRVWGQLVTENYFEVLGVRAFLGRTFLAEEGKTPGGHPVAVISHGLWQRRFGSDPNIVGRKITLNNHPFEIVGVAPPNFRGVWTGLSFDVFVPMMMQQIIVPGGDRLSERGHRWVDSHARLKPGVTLEQAQAEISTLSAQLAQDYPQSNKDIEARLYRIASSPRGAPSTVGPVLGILMALVGVFLLIACANVANLLLARATGRRREVAIRLAMGASRGRLVRLLLTESLALALLGGATGVLLSFWTSGLLSTFVPPGDLPIEMHFEISGTVIAFAVALSIVTGAIFGLAPALQASRADHMAALKDESAAAGRRSRVRSALVVSQVALSTLLLVCAALFVRSLMQAQQFDVGFNRDNVLLASVDLFPNGYEKARGIQFYREALQRLQALPGVESANIARRAPLGFGGTSSSSLRIEGFDAAGKQPWAMYNWVGPDYLRHMQIPLLRGREFTSQDTPEGPGVVVVSETMARMYWPERDPLGKRISFDSGETWRTVVGVARDTRFRRLNEEPIPFLYLPMLQSYHPQAVFQLRTQGDPLALASSLRATLQSIDPNLPVFDIRTFDQHVSASLFQQRLAGSLLAVFGAIALLLAAVGIYGVLAYSVGQRTREIGVRMALGAQRNDILGMVLRGGVSLVVLGLAVGVTIAVALTRLMSSVLFGVSPMDAASFAGAGLLLSAVALLACYLPARRATRVDPMVALRYE